MTTTLEVQVSSEDDAEVRRLSISNGSSARARSRSPRTPSWCSAPQAADVAHPAFSKMFVRTEFVARQGVLLAQSPAPRARRAGGVGLASRGHRGRHRRRARVRNRSRAIHRPRPRAARAAGHARGPRAVGHRRHGARRGVRAALPAARARGRHGAHRVLDLRRGEIARRCSSSPTSIAMSMRTPAPPRWPGPRRRCSCATSASTPRRPISSSSSRAASCTPTPRRARPAMPSSAAPPDPHGTVVAGHFRRPAHRADAHRGDRRSAGGARSCCRRTSTGASSGCSVDLVHPQRARRVLRAGSAGGARIHGAHAQGRPRIAGADTRGKVFVLRSDLVTPETRGALLAVARVVLSGRSGSLADQVERMQPTPPPRRRGCRGAHRAAPVAARRVRKPRASSSSSTASAALPRRAANTWSTATGGAITPAPWINVIANRGFGFHVSSRRRRLHLGAQQPRERAHAVEQRSGQRPARRGYLPARRGNAASCGARRPRPSAWKTRTTPARTASATAASSSARTACRSN